MIPNCGIRHEQQEAIVPLEPSKYAESVRCPDTLVSGDGPALVRPPRA
jgi:hypothetical protein